jgi:hypothetical protein
VARISLFSLEAAAKFDLFMLGFGPLDGCFLSI